MKQVWLHLYDQYAPSASISDSKTKKNQAYLVFILQHTAACFLKITEEELPSLQNHFSHSVNKLDRKFKCCENSTRGNKHGLSCVIDGLHANAISRSFCLCLQVLLQGGWDFFDKNPTLSSVNYELQSIGWLLTCPSTSWEKVTLFATWAETMWPLGFQWRGFVSVSSHRCHLRIHTELFKKMRRTP